MALHEELKKALLILNKEALKGLNRGYSKRCYHLALFSVDGEIPETQNADFIEKGLEGVKNVELEGYWIEGGSGTGGWDAKFKEIEHWPENIQLKIKGHLYLSCSTLIPKNIEVTDSIKFNNRDIFNIKDCVFNSKVVFDRARIRDIENVTFNEDAVFTQNGYLQRVSNTTFKGNASFRGCGGLNTIGPNTIFEQKALLSKTSHLESIHPDTVFHNGLSLRDSCILKQYPQLKNNEDLMQGSLEYREDLREYNIGTFGEVLEGKSLLKEGQPKILLSKENAPRKDKTGFPQSDPFPVSLRSDDIEQGLHDTYKEMIRLIDAVTMLKNMDGKQVGTWVAGFGKE